MLQKFRKRSKAQSVTEYAILLGLAIAAFAGMQLYVKRAMQAKIRNAAEATTSSMTGSNITSPGGTDYSLTDIDLGSTKQYEPYYTDSLTTSYSESVTREKLDGKGGLHKEIVSDISATAGGGYRAEKTYNASKSADDEW